MAKFLIGTLPVVGHVTPFFPIARTLVERGNEVRWYTGSKFREKVEATGATYIPMQAGHDFDDSDLDVVFPERKPLNGKKALEFDIMHVFGDSALGHVQDLRAVVNAYPADVLFADSAFIAARWLHALGDGPPWAVLNTLAVTLSSRDTAPFGMGLPPASSSFGRLRVRALHTLATGVLFRKTIAHFDTLRESLGLPPTREFIMDAVLSPYLYLQGTVAGFEYPRSDLAPQVHFIGPVLSPPSDDFNPPAWWNELEADRPVVHVTQGTLATEAEQLLIPTIKALANENVLVVATTGGKPVETLGLTPIPDNTRVERFIPHAHLLPHVDVMVTNGGYNGVQMALAHGVPLVAAGTSEDKPEVCARIAWAGVGINLKTAAPGEEKIRQAVTHVLADPGYRSRANALSLEFQQHHAPLEAAVLLEQLAATRAPVLRDSVDIAGQMTATTPTV